MEQRKGLKVSKAQPGKNESKKSKRSEIELGLSNRNG